MVNFDIDIVYVSFLVFVDVNGVVGIKFWVIKDNQIIFKFEIFFKKNYVFFFMVIYEVGSNG